MPRRPSGHLPAPPSPHPLNHLRHDPELWNHRLFLAIPGLLMVLEQRPRQTGVTAGPLRLLELPSPPSPPLSLHSCFTERAHVPPTPGSPHLRPLLPPLLTPTPDRSQQKALFSAHPSLKEEATAFAEKASSLLTQGPFRHLGFFFFFGLKHPRLGGVDSPSSFVFLEQESGSVGTLCTSCLGLPGLPLGPRVPGQAVPAASSWLVG